jgi:hypothetical protein
MILLGRMRVEVDNEAAKNGREDNDLRHSPRPYTLVRLEVRTAARALRNPRSFDSSCSLPRRGVRDRWCRRRWRLYLKASTPQKYGHQSCARIYLLTIENVSPMPSRQGAAGTHKTWQLVLAATTEHSRYRLRDD